MNAIPRAGLLALALLYPAAALAQNAPAAEPPTTPSAAVPGTHDCAAYFPVDAQRDNESGDVQVSYDVGADGTISNVRVVKTSGHYLLDRAAVACVSTAWRNTPAERGGIKIASAGHQAIIRFALTEPPPKSAPPAPEESDLPLLLGGAGLLVVILGGVAVFLYRQRRRKVGPPTLHVVGRDEEH